MSSRSLSFSAALVTVVGTLLAACASPTEGAASGAQDLASTATPDACRPADHCAFLDELGPNVCNTVPACRVQQTGAGCHGSPVASASDAQFCEKAVSQPDPQQACRIWGPSFNCVWTEGSTTCGSSQGGGGATGKAAACSVTDHCAFFGETGQCGQVPACKEVVSAAGCHGTTAASASDARFCESAVSQPDPHQACQIWGPAFNCAWTPGETKCVPKDAAPPPTACTAADHCAFFGELGQCGSVAACKQTVTDAGCHGSAVASASDARFCESAVSQPNPQQACQIWGPSFNCVWTAGETACVARDSNAPGDASKCGTADHCAFLGSVGQCQSVTACREAAAGAGCHGSPVASASDAAFCESAVSQPDPHQACQIWGPGFNCVWAVGETQGLPR
jgi:hypothetical protein